MVDQPARFAWYELLTTDVAAASDFYGKVVGWGATDASTPELAYTMLTAGDVPVGGLMDIPEEGRRLGATPRWVGYVAVDDIDATASQIRRRGGAVLLPPTDSNIGRVSVVADPQKANFALVSGLTYGQPQSGGLDELGRVGWHELLAEDRNKIFDFYSELFGWQKAQETDQADLYQLFSAAGQTIGGMLTKLPSVPQPCWLYYFNVDDIGTAAKRVNDGGGRILQGPIELTRWLLDRAMCRSPRRPVCAAGCSGSERHRATLRLGSRLVRQVGWHCLTGQDGAAKAEALSQSVP